MDIYFSEHFDVDADQIKDYGALDISLVSDLPLFVDPFLLFNSEDETYQGLHEGILDYLRFLRDAAADGGLDDATIDDLYRFQEVRQNWFGFTLFGNQGAGLGTDFAHALHDALREILTDFGEEEITKGSHLEKLCLIKPGVGVDSISDFTTNLIRAFSASTPRTSRASASLTTVARISRSPAPASTTRPRLGRRTSTGCRSSAMTTCC